MEGTDSKVNWFKVLPLVAAAGVSAFISYKMYKQLTFKVEPRVHRAISVAKEPKNVIKVLEYNLLAECYTKDEHSAHLNQSNLEFASRFQMIERELRESNADLLFLTELDNEPIYKKLLHEMGYEYQLASRRGLDAVMVAYKTAMFDYVEHFTVQHDQLGECFPPLTTKHANEFLRGNCSIYAILKHKNSGKQVQAICTHYHWNPERDFVKYAQLINTLKHAKSGMATILSGDFNSSPDANVLSFLTKADHKATPHEKVKTPNRVYYDQIDNKLMSDLKGKFVSAYSFYRKEGHPPFSVYSSHVDCIDFITYTQKDFKTVSLLETPTQLGQLAPAIPNENYPSDHLRIEACLELLM
jgi:mRNA deadenylase 3'-5' endonuclease subunit Ccr4